MTQVNPNLLETQRIAKRFPGVVALDRIDLELRRGETHILLGENGAGKSTLVKILSGVYQPDEGQVLYNGQPYRPNHTREAMQAGVRLIHQEINLLDYLSVAENLLFEDLPRRGMWVDYATLNRRAGELLEQVGLEIPPQTLVENLSIAQKQMVEIAKALSNESQLLILDEPTASLTNKEIARLFEIIHRLKQRGVTLLYISHRLQEIYEIGDRFTVLRNGQKVVTQDLQGTKVEEIVRMMVGHELAGNYPFFPEVPQGAELLQVENLRPKGSAHAVSFSVKAGEIVGIGGLVGSGRSEVLRAIFGADPSQGGRVLVEGKATRNRTPKDAVQGGISFLTENRKEEGLLLEMPCYANITLTNLLQVAQSGFIRPDQEQGVSQKYIQELSIKTPSSQQLTRHLSGGNQQKIVLAKWLFRNTKVLMIDEPTRGIDVGARYEIYLLLWELAKAGKAILMVSSDLNELMGISHRILVFSNGKIAGELPRSDFDQERILSLAYQEYLKERGAA